MNAPHPDSEWELLQRGTGREHLDDPASVPIGTGHNTTTFRFALAPAGVAPAGEESLPAPRKAARSMVRPYTRTGGRTRSDLALETLVSTSDRGRQSYDASSAEYRRICELCVETRSVAEVAALLAVPLGVGKILVEDLAEAGLVFIHKPGLVLGDRSSLDFLERVLNGIRAL